MINEIKLALLKNKPNVKLKKEITKLYKQNLVSPYALNSSMYNAIYRLRYKAYLNIKALRLFYPQQIENNKKYLTGIFDSFFFMDEILFIKRTLTIIKSNKSNKTKFLNSDNLLKTIEFLITDSIFANYRIIELINIFGKSYMFNHSTLAQAHEKLMHWAMRYHSYILAFNLVKVTRRSSLQKNQKTRLNHT